METKITFIGTAAAVPGAREDTACFLINDTILFDCGWCAALHMQQYGYSPLQIETLFFTHCHHDHYLGLPALIFFRGMRGRNAEQPRLQIVGPPDDLPLVVELTHRFLQAERFPAVWTPLDLHPLEPGATYETAAFRIDTVRALHPVTGVCGRFTDKSTGIVIAFSGDTAPNAALVELARGADLLIHEASLPSQVADEQMRGDHSRAIDAARVACDAGVRRLRLVHIGNHREASLAAAREIFPATELAVEGETLLLTR
ncbi:MAG: MBL fold metallo-hydrolase [Armatimonadota bacterium]|nr:MBL fold metallo-hydrolase [Armatimonadota bacterium]